MSEWWNLALKELAGISMFLLEGAADLTDSLGLRIKHI